MFSNRRPGIIILFLSKTLVMESTKKVETDSAYRFLLLEVPLSSAVVRERTVERLKRQSLFQINVGLKSPSKAARRT